MLLQNWPKTRFWIGRSAVAPSDSDTAEKNRKCGCTIIILHQMYNCHKVILENLLPVWRLMRTNTFVPSHFWTTFTKFDTSCLRYVVKCWKNFGKKFVQVHMHVLGPKPLRWNFIKIFLLSIQSGAHKLFRRFFDFSQFLIAILRKLWRHPATQVRKI